MTQMTNQPHIQAQQATASHKRLPARTAFLRLQVRTCIAQRNVARVMRFVVRIGMVLLCVALVLQLLGISIGSEQAPDTARMLEKLQHPVMSVPKTAQPIEAPQPTQAAQSFEQQPSVVQPVLLNDDNEQILTMSGLYMLLIAIILSYMVLLVIWVYQKDWFYASITFAQLFGFFALGLQGL